jgi:hypothetical protein
MEPIHPDIFSAKLSGRVSALRHEVVMKCGTTNARVSKLSLPHFICDTPMFMPVGTCGAVKGMTTEELEELDCHLILGNTYHLALRPGTGYGSTLRCCGSGANIRGVNAQTFLMNSVDSTSL